MRRGRGGPGSSRRLAVAVARTCGWHNRGEIEGMESSLAYVRRRWRSGDGGCSHRRKEGAQSAGPQIDERSGPVVRRYAGGVLACITMTGLVLWLLSLDGTRGRGLKQCVVSVCVRGGCHGYHADTVYQARAPTRHSIPARATTRTQSSEGNTNRAESARYSTHSHRPHTERIWRIEESSARIERTGDG